MIVPLPFSWSEVTLPKRGRMPTLLFWSGSAGREEETERFGTTRPRRGDGERRERRWTRSCSSPSDRSWSRSISSWSMSSGAGGVLAVTVDRAGGVDLDALTTANRAVSRALDELDPIPGRYSLEVSSPGLERPLRTPAHFARAIGETITVKTRPQVPGERRRRGPFGGSRRRRLRVGPGADGGCPATVAPPRSPLQRHRSGSHRVRVGTGCPRRTAGLGPRGRVRKRRRPRSSQGREDAQRSKRREGREGREGNRSPTR